MFSYPKPCQKIWLSAVLGFSGRSKELCDICVAGYRYGDGEGIRETDKKLAHTSCLQRLPSLEVCMGSCKPGEPGKATVWFSQWCRLQIHKEPLFQFMAEGRIKPKPQISKPWGTKILFWRRRPVPRFNESLQLIRWGWPTLGRVICFTQPTNFQVVVSSESTLTFSHKRMKLGHLQRRGWT